MKMNDMFPSNYLKKEDVMSPRVFTITGVAQEEIKSDDGKEMKNILHFQEPGVKPMVLNKGNALTIAAIYGDESDAWRGKRIEVYADMSVMMAGKRVGGIRVRAPGGYAPVHVAPPAAANSETAHQKARRLVADTEESLVLIGRCQPGDVMAFLRQKAATAYEKAGKVVPAWVDDLTKWGEKSIALVPGFIAEFEAAVSQPYQDAAVNGDGSGEDEDVPF